MKKQLRERILTAVEQTVAEFHSTWRQGVHYNWKEPGPARWDMWTVIDILHKMEDPPENEKLRNRITEMSIRITDLAIERTRNGKSKNLITAKVQQTAEILYRVDIKELEELD